MDVIFRKICLVGDFAVGKTSLIRRFVDRAFSDRYLSTVGVKIARKQLEVSPSSSQTQKVELVIWDIEGQTKFQGIVPSYLQGAKGAIIVGDLSRTETIGHIKDHLQLFAAINSEQAKVIVAFNKLDLVDEPDAAQLAKLHQFQNYPQVLETYITSAKTNTNVDDMFYQLAQSLAT